MPIYVGFIPAIVKYQHCFFLKNVRVMRGMLNTTFICTFVFFIIILWTNAY